MKTRKIDRLGGIVLCIMTIFALVACAKVQKETMLKQESTSAGVFREVQKGEPWEKGKGDLLIRASLKTPVAGFHLFEIKTHLHGKPDYPFLINIDGQAGLWKADRITEDLSESGGTEEKGPEAGPGVRYVLEKTIRLAPGSHTVFFALPEDGYFIQNIIQVEEGRANVLEYRPLYRKHSKGVTENFEHGVARYEVYLNGSRLEQGQK